MHPIYRNDGASVELVPVDLADVPGAYQIYQMWCDPIKRGKGYANRLCRAVAADADKNGTLLLTFPAPFDSSPEGSYSGIAGMSLERLVKWYEGYGFVTIQDSPLLMARMPVGCHYDLSTLQGEVGHV